MPGGQNLNFAVAVEHAMEIVRNPKKFKSDYSGNTTKEKNTIVLEQKILIKTEKLILAMLMTTTMV